MMNWLFMAFGIVSQLVGIGTNNDFLATNGSIFFFGGIILNEIESLK